MASIFARVELDIGLGNPRLKIKVLSRFHHRSRDDPIRASREQVHLVRRESLEGTNLLLARELLGSCHKRWNTRNAAGTELVVHTALESMGNVLGSGGHNALRSGLGTAAMTASHKTRTNNIARSNNMKLTGHIGSSRQNRG